MGNPGFKKNGKSLAAQRTPIACWRSGDTLTFTTGQKTYTLKKQLGNPLGNAG